MKRILLALAFVCMASPAVPQEQVDLQIKLPSVMEPGALIRVDATASNASDVKFDILPKTKFELDTNGRVLYFAAPQGQYILFVSGAKGDKVAQEIIKIDLGLAGPETLETKIKQWLPNVPKEEIKKVAASFENSIATNLEGQQLMDALAASNRTVLGTNLTNWTPFFDQLAGYCQANQVTDLRAFFKQVAACLNTLAG